MRARHALFLLAVHGGSGFSVSSPPLVIFCILEKRHPDWCDMLFLLTPSLPLHSVTLSIPAWSLPSLELWGGPETLGVLTSTLAPDCLWIVGASCFIYLVSVAGCRFRRFPEASPALGSVCLWLSFHPPLDSLILNVNWGTPEDNSRTAGF